LPVFEPGRPRQAALVGLAIAALDGTASYVPIAHTAGPNLTPEQWRGWPALGDALVPKIGGDLKSAGQVFERAGLEFAGLDLDLGVASFLCDPERDHS